MLFDPGASDFLADPYRIFARLRGEGEVLFHSGFGMPVTLTHAAASQVLRSRSFGRVWVDKPDAPAFNLLHRHSLLELEGDAHRFLRGAVAAEFTRGRVESLMPWLAEVAERAVAGITEGTDVIAAVAADLPITVIAKLLGVTGEARRSLRRWSDTIVRMYEPTADSSTRRRAEAAAAEFSMTLRSCRFEPDGLLAALGDRLAVDDVVGTAALLLMAGHEGSVNLLGNGLFALLTHPDQAAALAADPSLAPLAVEEFLRFDPPLQLFERTALVDTEVCGYPVAAGSKIAALLGAAAHDPDIFADPTQLHIDRDPNPHLGFGLGVHFCLGAPLARAEAVAFFTALAPSLPRLRLLDYERSPRFTMRGFSRLVVGYR